MCWKWGWESTAGTGQGEFLLCLFVPDLAHKHCHSLDSLFFLCFLPKQSGVRQGERGIACEVTQIESGAFLKEQMHYKYTLLFFACDIVSYRSLEVKWKKSMQLSLFMSCLYVLPRVSLGNGNPWGRPHFQALLCCASQGCCKENAFLFSNNCFHFNLQMMWKCFCWPWVWLKLVFTNGRTKLRQPQSFGSPGSSARDMLLLRRRASLTWGAGCGARLALQPLVLMPARIAALAEASAASTALSLPGR